MSGDFSDDYQGLADWLDGFEFGGSDGEPAYPASFGWTPPLIPLPRRAPDEVF
ncbi:hypothetical protein ACQPZF_38460 [Actinosynnema sp. CS-041913]|uniref:hypothetical protein n=1 Tax=Actinosynnema sp. CS-041913 TaxID=3239917 RepID=UPI003D8F27E6